MKQFGISSNNRHNLCWLLVVALLSPNQSHSQAGNVETSQESQQITVEQALLALEIIQDHDKACIGNTVRTFSEGAVLSASSGFATLMIAFNYYYRKALKNGVTLPPGLATHGVWSDLRNIDRGKIESRQKRLLKNGRRFGVYGLAVSLVALGTLVATDDQAIGDWFHQTWHSIKNASLADILDYVFFVSTPGPGTMSAAYLTDPDAFIDRFLKLSPEVAQYHFAEEYYLRQMAVEYEAVYSKYGDDHGKFSCERAQMRAFAAVLNLKSMLDEPTTSVLPNLRVRSSQPLTASPPAAPQPEPPGQDLRDRDIYDDID